MSVNTGKVSIEKRVQADAKDITKGLRRCPFVIGIHLWPESPLIKGQ